MALPLPNVIPDVGPGGGINTALGGINALANAFHQRKYNQIKTQYAPTTLGAEAASKLAYANLMGPQFLAKIMGNEGALANMTEGQKNAALDLVRRAGMGGGTGINAFNQIQGNQPGMMPQQVAPNNSLSAWFANKVKGVFGDGNQQPANALVNPMPQPSQNDNYRFPSPEAPQQEHPSNPALMAYDKWFKSPEGKAEMAKGENGNFPNEQEVMQWANKNQMPNQRPKTYAEKTGEFKGTLEEGKEAGKIRAKDIKELNDAVFKSKEKEDTYKELNSILGSPEFEQIRKIPLAGRHEISYYEIQGTPEQKEMIGKYKTLIGNIIKASSRDFAGQFRKGEQTLLEDMKPGPKDTVESARGKAEILTFLNKMLQERASLTSKYMKEHHLDKLEASELADKKINGDKIRKEIHNTLNPMITIRNNKTGEKKTISISEARKLGVPNV